MNQVPPDPPAAWGFIEWSVTTLGALLAFALSGLWWLAGSSARTKSTLSDHAEDIKELRADAKQRAEKQDSRHEENLRAIGRIPDMEAFRRLEDRIDGKFKEFKALLAPAHR